MTIKYCLQWPCGWQDSCRPRSCNFLQFGDATFSKNILHFSPKSACKKHTYLRTLKDADGNYLWNHNNDTILGKQVIISEYMPDAEEGTKPIAFGDFSYYWVVDRKPVSLRVLIELFAEVGQIGYLAYKFLEGKLIRKNAIKVIQMKTAK